MSDSFPKLTSPPIVEAVIDFECDLPPLFDLKALEQPARLRASRSRPLFRRSCVITTQPFSWDGEAIHSVSGVVAVKRSRRWVTCAPFSGGKFVQSALAPVGGCYQAAASRSL